MTITWLWMESDTYDAELLRAYRHGLAIERVNSAELRRHERWKYLGIGFALGVALAWGIWWA